MATESNVVPAALLDPARQACFELLFSRPLTAERMEELCHWHDHHFPTAEESAQDEDWCRVNDLLAYAQQLESEAATLRGQLAELQASFDHVCKEANGQEHQLDLAAGYLKEARAERDALRGQLAAAEARLARFDGHVKHNGMMLPDLTHAEVADRVRMLMRSDLDHEVVCVLGRNRIIHLANQLGEAQAENAALSARLQEAQAATGAAEARAARLAYELEAWKDHCNRDIEGQVEEYLEQNPFVARPLAPLPPIYPNSLFASKDEYDKMVAEVVRRAEASENLPGESEANEPPPLPPCRGECGACHSEACTPEGVAGGEVVRAHVTVREFQQAEPGPVSDEMMGAAPSRGEGDSQKGGASRWLSRRKSQSTCGLNMPCSMPAFYKLLLRLAHNTQLSRPCSWI